MNVATRAAVVTALSAVSAFAAQPSTQPTALLQQMDAAYGSLHRLETNGTLSATFDVGGQQSHPLVHFTSRFESRGKFRHDAGADVLLGSTGTQVYAYQPARHVYLLDPAPTATTPGAWPAAVTNILLEQNPSLLLALSGKSGDALKDIAGEMHTVPDVQLADRPYPAFGFTVPGDKRNVTMVLDPSTHLLRQVRFDLKESLEARGTTDVKQASVLVDYDCTVADGPAPAADAFAWTPPAGAIPAPASNAPPVAADDDNPAAALAGKPAPDFTLKGLDGKDVKLSGLKGSVVILDFWATWCGPCVGSLPHLDALYKDKKADGLKVFAVNLQEEHDAVKSFVDGKGWSLPILLDTTGDVAKQYLANAIPETVVVGKDGSVAKVFVGSGNEDNIKVAAEVAMK